MTDCTLLIYNPATSHLQTEPHFGKAPFHLRPFAVLCRKLLMIFAPQPMRI